MKRLFVNFLLLYSFTVFICVAIVEDEFNSTTNTLAASTTTLSASSPSLTTAATIDTDSSSTTTAVPPISSSTVTDVKQTKYLTADDLPACQYNSANFNDCLLNLFNIMVPRLKDGNPELNIPSLDPFTLNRTTFQYTNGVVSGRIILRNALAYGFSNIQFKTMDMQVNNNEIKLSIKNEAPQVNVIGNYKAEVLINNVRLRPRGTFNITMMNVNIDPSGEGVFYEKNGHRFVRLTKFDADPKIKDFKFTATGIFPDPTLNEIALNVVNQYWRDIFRIFLPETRKYWAPMILRIMNEVLSVVPFDNFVKEK